MSIESFIRSVEADVTAFLHDEGEQAVAELREQLSEPYPPASDPGDPPHRRSGQLASSIVYSLTGTTLRIGSTDPKAQYLEYGTERMAARPFLRPANERLLADLAVRLAEYLRR